EYDTSTYQYKQAPVYTAAPGGPPSGTTVVTPPPPPPRMTPPRIAPQGSMWECFGQGTLVWTQAGPTPIEHIAVGDMVLSQHPETGELSYRAVLQTTVGDETPMLHVTIDGETITATGGHRFWVSGEGWKMAKRLQTTARLHALAQPA